MKFQVVIPQGVATFPNDAEFAKYAAHNRLTLIGVSGHPQLMPELHGHPKFKELAGPMAGRDDNGDFCARYETWAVYESLSR